MTCHINRPPHCRFINGTPDRDPIKASIQPGPDSWLCKKMFIRVKICRMVECDLYPCQPKNTAPQPVIAAKTTTGEQKI